MGSPVFLSPAQSLPVFYAADQKGIFFCSVAAAVPVLRNFAFCSLFSFRRLLALNRYFECNRRGIAQPGVPSFTVLSVSAVQKIPNRHFV